MSLRGISVSGPVQRNPPRGDIALHFLKECERVDAEPVLADTRIDVVEMVQHDAGRIVDFNCPFDDGCIEHSNPPCLLSSCRQFVVTSGKPALLATSSHVVSPTSAPNCRPRE